MSETPRHSHGLDPSLRVIEALDNLVLDGPEATDTLRYISPRFPELYIRTARTNITRQDSIDDIRTDYGSYLSLEEAGFTVPPFWVEPRDGQLFIMTHRVIGVPLDEELQRNPALIETFDAITKQQILIDGELRGQDKTYPTDTMGAHQFMWGTIAGSGEQSKIYYVNVNPTGNMFTNFKYLAKPAIYADNLTHATRSVIDDENILGTSLNQSRQAIYSEISKALYENPEAHVVEQLTATGNALTTGNLELVEEY